MRATRVLAAQLRRGSSGRREVRRLFVMLAILYSILSRYVNMDYVFVSAMLHNLVVQKLVIYDIACQWSIHLVERIAAFPSHLQIELPEDDVRYGVPKLHFAAHTTLNHSQYSLNYQEGAARTDGEGIERRWWFVQPVAMATIGMGPGRRQNVMEDQFGYSNWRKYAMMRKYRLS